MKPSGSWFAMWPVMAFLGVLLVACGGQSNSGRSDESLQPHQTQAGPVAEDFSVRTGPESSFSLRDHKGEIVVLYFSFPG